MNLTDQFCVKMIQQFAGIKVSGMPYEYFVNEDYMWVLSDLNERGIKEAECDVWCDVCDDEVIAMVNTDTLHWTCPICSGHFDHNSEAVLDEDIISDEEILFAGKTREEIIDSLVEHEIESADEECIHDWIRNGVHLIGFSNMTDEQLIEDYKEFILTE